MAAAAIDAYTQDDSVEAAWQKFKSTFSNCLTIHCGPRYT